METNELDISEGGNLDEDTNEEYTNESDDNSNIINESDDNSDIVLDEEEQSKGKNTSNFKRLSKAYKGALAKLKELEVKNQIKTKEELRFFFLENPESIKYKEQITNMLSDDKYKNLDMSDILDLAKLRTPKESTDKNDFSFKSNTGVKSKKLEDLTEEDALKLDNKTFLEWDKKRNTKNSFDEIWG